MAISVWYRGYEPNAHWVGYDPEIPGPYEEIDHTGKRTMRAYGAHGFGGPAVHQAVLAAQAQGHWEVTFEDPLLPRVWVEVGVVGGG